MDASYGPFGDLTGIEFFTELIDLNCSNSEFYTLDVSANTKLQTLDCSYNELANLDVSSCTLTVTQE